MSEAQSNYEAERFHLRVPRAFKENTEKLIGDLHTAGLRDDTSVSAYVREAVEEKRRRDEGRLQDGLTAAKKSKLADFA